MPQDQLFSNMEQGQEQARSILENYILARKGILDRKQQTDKAQADIENVQSEIEARKQLHDESMKRLEYEHEVQQANIKLLSAQTEAHHLQAANTLRKGILDKEIPTPPQGDFDPNNSAGDRINPNLPPQPINNSLPVGNIQNPQPFQQLQAPNLPGSYPNQPLTVNGITLKGNEYQTAEQVAAARRPLIEQHQRDLQNEEYAKAFGKSAGEGTAEGLPGGKTEQKIEVEQPKLIEEANKDAADIKSRERIAKDRDETSIIVGRGHDATRMAAARISEATKGQLTPDELETRMLQLKFGEGPPLGKTPNDLLAATGLRQAGGTVVSPTAVKNLQRMSPLEHFCTDLNDFADKYLSDNKAGSVLSTIKLNAPYSEAKNEFNKLLLNSTNIAVSVEGASGRILMAQINVAKDFIANKFITKEQLKSNADKLMQLTLNAAESQLGNLKPSQRVELMDHWNMSTLAANESKRWKLGNNTATSPAQNAPPTSRKGLLGDPNWVIKGTQ